MYTLCFSEQPSSVERIIMFLKCLNVKPCREWLMCKYVVRYHFVVLSEHWVVGEGLPHV